MNKKILKLAIPNIISNISIPLLGIVDMALMGHLESDSYIGAIALGSLIFNFIYWGFSFLRAGTSGFTAQAWGRRDLAETIHVFSRAALISLIAGLLLLLIQRPIELLSLLVLRGEGDVETLAASYFRIRIWAAPAALGQFALLGWFIGMQNARFPMIVLIITNLINIIFNFLFVMVLGMSSDGVALGTVIAQYSGFIVAAFLFKRFYGRLFKYWSKKAVLQWTKISNFLLVNKDLFIRTMCLVIVFSFFTARSATTDTNNEGIDTILAVNSILMQYFMLFSFLIDGFAHASEALTGRFIGARNRKSLNKSIKLLFAWGASISIFFTLLYLLGGNIIFRLLTDNQQVIENARPYFFWVIIIPTISFTAFIWDGIYIGATAGKAMRNSMLIATILIFFPAYIILSKYLGNHGLWFAFILFMVARSASMSIMAPKAVYGSFN